MGGTRFRRLFSGGAELRQEGGTLQVRVRDRFTADLIERSCRSALDQAAAEIGAPDGVRYEIEVERAEGSAPVSVDTSVDAPVIETRPVDIAPAPAVRRGESAGLFEPSRSMSDKLARFVVGRSNRLGHAAASAMAGGHGAPGLVFLHGGPGMGKTHLLTGIAQGVGARLGKSRVRSVSADTFIGQYVNAMREGRIDGFQRRYRGVGLLCIDDVHLVAGKKGTQDELLRTLDALLESGSMVALASDAPPEGIKSLSEALASRFGGGVVARLDPPDRDLRAELVVAFAARLGLSLSRGAIEHLCDRTDGTRASVRDVEGMVKQVAAVRSLLGKGAMGEVSAVEAAHALDLRNAGTASAALRKSPPKLPEIRAACAEAMGVREADLLGRGRTRRIVLAREITVLLARRLTGLSFPEIAAGMSRANHSTPITQFRNMEQRLEAGELLGVDGASDARTIGEIVQMLERSLRPVRSA